MLQNLILQFSHFVITCFSKSEEICLKSPPPPSHLILSNKLFSSLSYTMFNSYPFFNLCSLDLLLQNEGVLSFRAGRSQEAIQEVSLTLHWMMRMMALLKVREIDFASSRGSWAASIISSPWMIDRNKRLFQFSVFYSLFLLCKTATEVFW